MHEEHKEIDAFFRGIGCATSAPGFYNDPAFIEAEKDNHELLDRYADFVLTHPSRASLDIVNNTATFIFERLLSDGRLGACIDASSLLSEFLNRQGVWNFVTKGGASLLVPHRKNPIRMAPISAQGNVASTGHAWVVAPPFRVIDITLFLQPYDPDVRAILPGRFIASADAEAVAPRYHELVDPEVEAAVNQSGGVQHILGPGKWARISVLGSWKILIDGIEARYAATGVSAMDAQLEDWTGFKMGGANPAELWSVFKSTADNGSQSTAPPSKFSNTDDM